jgi:hypothetical protein
MTTLPTTRFLRLVLAADAAASGATGLALAAAPAAIAGLTGLPALLLFGAGLVFLPYAALVAWLATRDAMPRWLVWGLAGGNLVIAVECAALPLLGLVAPNGIGIAVLALLAVTVAVFAELYIVAMRRLPRGA